MDKSKASPPLSIATGKDEVVERLTDLIGKFERGEISCAALRVYNADGTWEDLVVGDDEQERAQALADLHRGFLNRQ
jgi:hypothetical protein